MPNMIEKMVGDMGAAAMGALVLLGDRLGLYKALAEAPATAAELADRSGLHEPYVREWLRAQAASGYAEYDAQSERFSMTDEQQAVLADSESPVLMTGAYYSLASLFHDEPRIAEAFKSGDGMPWSDHSGCLFCGVEKFFRPSYKGHLVAEWLPALDGVRDKLERGARVADVGCGHGVSTLVMAEAFPQSRFVGFDYHGPSVEHASNAAREAGIRNVSFEEAKAKEFGGDPYDLVCFFDCLHDMGDPAGAAAHARSRLKADGTLMVVEPQAGDTLAENLNPVGRVYYAFSTMVCMPTSLSQEVALGLGAQAGEETPARSARARRIRTRPARGGDALQHGPRSPPVVGRSRPTPYSK